MPHINLLLSDLQDSQPTRVKSGDFAIVVVRQAEAVFAYEDVCPHAFWPLSGGEVHSGVIECNGHAWEFDVQSGRCLNAPAYCLNAVAVTIHGDQVTLSLDAAQKSIQPRRPQSSSASIPTLA